MGLSLGLGIFYARLKNILCLLNELAMQINCIPSYAILRVIFSEDVIRSLFVILLG